MNSLKLILNALIVLVLVGCGSGAVEPISPPETTQSQSPTPTSISSESLASPYEFVGNGDGSTPLFDVNNGDVVLIKYTGGPITVYWVESGNSPRQIYNGPSSNNGKYDTSVGDSGRYSINIKCDGDCEWAVVIETDQTQQQDNDKTADEGNSKLSNASIVKEEWDVFSQSEASVILSTPNTRAITLAFNPEARIATITGAKTSVPPKANVMVANLQLGNFVLVKADQDGKFQAEIDGHPGTHILIKQDTTGQIFIIEDPEATHSANTLRTIFPPGVLLRIPVEDSETGVSFSSAGRLPSDEDAPWTIKGNLAQTQLSPSQEVEIFGQVAIRTRESNPPLGGQLSFEAHLLINANGRQVGGGQPFHNFTFYSN